MSEELAANHYNIDNGDDILYFPSQKEPNGKLILNTPQRSAKDVARLRFAGRRRNRQQPMYFRPGHEAIQMMQQSSQRPSRRIAAMEMGFHGCG